MEYSNLNGNSNVRLYYIGDDNIRVVFKNNRRIYKYSYSSAGVHHVEEMKKLAKIGHGLNSYINLNCKMLYDKNYVEDENDN